MKEVHLQGAPISAIQLDVKQHSNKTLSELQMLLQTASTLKGAVTGISKEGNVIFTTVQGKFSAQIPTLAQTLNKGDKLTLKIEFDNDQLIGRVTSINAVPVKEVKAVTINLVELAAGSSAIRTRTSGENIDINPLKLPQAPLKVIVDYLNLSQISKNSALGEVLTPMRNGSMIELKLTAINQTSSKSPYSVIGEVLSSDANKQIIKTPFGIVSANSAEPLPVGKKIQIEIKAVDNKLVDNINISSNLEDFIFKFNNASPLLKSLFNIPTLKYLPQESIQHSSQDNEIDSQLPVNNTTSFQTLKTQVTSGLLNVDSKIIVSNLLQNTEQLNYLMNSLGAKTPADLVTKLNLLPKEQIVALFESKIASSPKVMQSTTIHTDAHRTHSLQSNEDKQEQALKANIVIEKAIQSPHAKETILKLSDDFSKIKELLNIEVKPDESNKWLNFFIPIYDGERVTQNKVAIFKKPNQYIRFVVELSLEAMGDLQLDGLIKLKPASNLIENFDLAVRFKDRLSLEVQIRISEIYTLTQTISGIKGGLNFERVDSFSNEPSNPL